MEQKLNQERIDEIIKNLNEYAEAQLELDRLARLGRVPIIEGPNKDGDPRLLAAQRRLEAIPIPDRAEAEAAVLFQIRQLAAEWEQSRANFKAAVRPRWKPGFSGTRPKSVCVMPRRNLSWACLLTTPPAPRTRPKKITTRSNIKNGSLRTGWTERFIMATSIRAILTFLKLPPSVGSKTCSASITISSTSPALKSSSVSPILCLPEWAILDSNQPRRSGCCKNIERLCFPPGGGRLNGPATPRIGRARQRPASGFLFGPEPRGGAEHHGAEAGRII